MANKYKIIAKFKSDQIILFHKEKIEKETIIHLNIKQKDKLIFH